MQMQCKNCSRDLPEQSKFCPSCGSPAAALRVESATVEHSTEGDATKAKSKTHRVAVVVFPVLLITGLFVFIQFLNPSVHPVIKAQPVVTSEINYDTNFVEMKTIAFREDGDDLVFSLNELIQKRLVRFEYRGGKTPRAVMAYLAPTGQLVTAISSSEHCGSTEFKIKQNNVYCALCPSKWDMMTMEAYACCAKYYPDPIPSRVVGDEVHIPKVSVERWAGRL